MKAAIISDTHGQAQYLERIIQEEWPADALIHCGDFEEEEDYIEALAECPFYCVAGNNDYWSDAAGEITFEFGGKRVFLTHGHTYGVSRSVERIREEAFIRDADIVLFGHTHRPYLEITDRLVIANPGSLGYPRQIPRKRTYLMLEILENGRCEFSLKYIK